MVEAVADRTELGASAHQQMTGGQALVASPLRQGIDTIFALPGVQLDGAFDALYDAQQRGDIRVIHPRHEQTTAYMADGYARVTGRLGTCLVVPGPGLLNATAALSTAYSCNSPVLCVTGQIQSNLIGFGRGQLHEIPNQLEMIRSVTKHSQRALKPEDVPALVDTAVSTLWQGRVRPVEIEIPPDTLFAKGDIQLLPGVPARDRPAGDPDQIAAAAKLLGAATSPIIFVGGGIHGAEAWDELRELAELLEAPVVMTSNGKGAISSRHHLAHSTLGASKLLPEADVVLTVGTRFVEPATAPWGLGPNRTVIQMDIDAEEIGRNYPVTVGILADARAGLAALANEVGKHNRIRESRETELRAVQDWCSETFHRIKPQAGFADAIRQELPEDGIFVGEMTQMGYFGNSAFPVYQPRTYFTPGYQGTLGWGFPTSLGVKIGAPDQVVISVNGDGGFGFALNELATQAHHGIASITLVFNDTAYGNVKRIQTVEFAGRTIASDLTNPDYMKLAGAFGVTGRTATTPAELATQLRESIKANEPTLIEIPVPPMPDVLKELRLR
ncbi:MAG TPA: thiamine pyrophosphate-dependent enzyme [Thermomicrobiales bacterium]|nr:thiamine pyrophosphate-dependent enzyme [Thermomicrobiales bacterium]